MSMRDRIKTKAAASNKQMEANRFMVNSLYSMVQYGHIKDEYDIGFITSMYERVHAGRDLNDKQQTYLDKCFHEKY